VGDPLNISVTDNPSELRYELHVDGELTGQIRYRREASAVVLVHTDIEPRFEGHGLHSRLVQGALDDLRARGLALVPLCPHRPRHHRHGDAAVMQSFNLE
jgi:predicted GNAT family acetyltransferase